MTQRQLVKVAIALMVLVIGLQLVVLLLTPPSRQAAIADTTAEATDSADTNLQFATLSGDNLDGETLTFPTDFAGDLNLVVMPFDRDQQTNAIQWLPTFAVIAERYPQIAYYSIAVLEDLAPLIRVLVVQGLNVAISDTATRQRTIVTFIANQQEFVSVLGDSDMSQMRVLVVNRAGQVLYQHSGAFSEADGLKLQQAVDGLLAP